MIDAAFAIPGDIDTATGGYSYARKVLRLLPEFGVNGHHLVLPGSFPEPTGPDLEATKLMLEQIHPDTPVLFDGLAFGALPDVFVDNIKSPLIALVHHPLAHESGLSHARQRELYVSERAALGKAKAVIASSAWTARMLREEYGVSGARLTVAEPGTEPAIRSRGTGMPFMILAVGALIPRKGYPVLIEALNRLGRDNWELAIIGALDHDRAEANQVRELVLASGLRSRITIAGRVSEKELARHYARADLFVLPSLYEGYGMVLAEAMARGLPIVCTTGSAAAETVPDAAAIKVAPGDVEALSQAIAKVLDDEAMTDKMSDASWQAGLKLPRWSECVEKVAAVIKAVHGERGA